MSNPTGDSGGPGGPPPPRPIRPAVGRIGRPSRPKATQASPAKQKPGPSYNIRHYTRNPIEQWPEGGDLTEEEHKAKKRLHDGYMRTQLWGFTINELQDGGCWDDPNALPSDLHRTGFIHPIFRYEMWETGTDCEDIGNGYSGTWDVKGNEAVREALNPSLYLASLLLTHSATWTWFDALLFSPRKEVTPADPRDTKDGCDPSKSGYRTFEFRARDPVAVQHSQETFETYAAALQAKITLCIKSAVLRSEKAGNDNLVYGWHRPSYTVIESGAVYIEDYTGVTHLSSEMVLPLLADDLTVSERLVQQFCVAKTLVHETMHSFGKYMQAKLPNVVTRGAEPFFEDEEICELGRSWENACFGGQVDHLYIRDKTNFTEPSLGQVIFPWPSWYHFGDGKVTTPIRSRYRYHDNFPDGALARMWVMPMFFIQNIQQVSYWVTQVSSYGVDALKSEQIIGHLLTKGKGCSEMVWGRDARPDPVAGRVFPKRDTVPTVDCINDLLAAAKAVRQSAVADIVNAALQQQQMSADITALAQMEVDQEELDQQKKLLNDILAAEGSGQEIDNSGLLDTLAGSKYPEVRIRASLAAVKNVMVDISRRKRLCTSVQTEARALATESGADEKWSVFAGVATAELENISREEQDARRKRKDDGPESPGIKKPNAASRS